MSTSALRFLQQENNRLNKKVTLLEQEKTTLAHSLEMISELYWISQLISSEENPTETLDYLLKRMIRSIGAKDGSISRLDRETDELEFLLVHGELRGQLVGFRLKADTGIAGWVVSNQEPIIVNTPRQDWRFSQIVDNEFGFLSQSMVSVPIMDKNTLVGIIQLLNKKGNNFTDIDIQILLILGHIASTVIDKIKVKTNTPDFKLTEFVYP